MYKSPTLYSIISYTALTIALAYLATSQWLISKEAGPNGQLAFFTGTPRVILNDDLLKLSFVRSVDQVVLAFRDRIAEEYISTARVADYAVTFGSEYKHSIQITSRSRDDDVESLGFDHVQLQVGRAFSSGHFRDREISHVVVDGEVMEPYAFLDKVLVRQESSLTLYYPFALNNISGQLAHSFGPVLLGAIQVALLLLVVTQLVLLIVSVRLRPDGAVRYFSDPANNPAITSVDRIANEFAIPMGLMGTVTAIWLSLEQPSATFSSFEQILSILRIAIFTSVLGFVTKVLCLTRSSLHSTEN